MSLKDDLGKRCVGAVAGAAVGVQIGAGTDIVGGPFDAVASIAVFTTIGATVGSLGGPDVAEDLKSGFDKLKKR